MRLDAKQLTEAYSGETHGQSFSTTDEEFINFSKEMKEMAKDQAAKSKVEKASATTKHKKNVDTLRPNEEMRDG